MEGFVGQTREEEIAVVEARSDQGVHKDGNSMEGWRRLILRGNRSGKGEEREVEVDKLSDVIKVGVKRQCAVEDDT